MSLGAAGACEAWQIPDSYDACLLFRLTATSPPPAGAGLALALTAFAVFAVNAFNPFLPLVRSPCMTESVLTDA